MLACFDTSDTLIGFYDTPLPAPGCRELVLNQVDASMPDFSEFGSAISPNFHTLRIPVEIFRAHVRIEPIAQSDLMRRFGNVTSADLAHLVKGRHKALLALPGAKTSLDMDPQDGASILRISVPCARIPESLAEEVFDHSAFTPV
jgi:hypothetical protein